MSVHTGEILRDRVRRYREITTLLRPFKIVSISSIECTLTIQYLIKTSLS